MLQGVVIPPVLRVHPDDLVPDPPHPHPLLQLLRPSLQPLGELVEGGVEEGEGLLTAGLGNDVAPDLGAGDPRLLIHDLNLDQWDWLHALLLPKLVDELPILGNLRGK